MFDLNKLKGYAKKQREQDSAESETSVEAYGESKEPAAEIDEEIYIPTDDDEDIMPIPDEYWEAQTAEMPDNDNEDFGDIIEKCFPEKAYNIELERLLPYRKNIFLAVPDENLIKSLFSILTFMRKGGIMYIDWR